MLSHLFSPEAIREFDDAFDWYENQATGLGDRFAASVHQSLELICRFPLASACVYSDARRRLVKRFPYVVIYRADAEIIQVISVFHTSRDPMICSPG